MTSFSRNFRIFRISLLGSCMWNSCVEQEVGSPVREDVWAGEGRAKGRFNMVSKYFPRGPSARHRATQRLLYHRGGLWSLLSWPLLPATRESCISWEGLWEAEEGGAVLVSGTNSYPGCQKWQKLSLSVTKDQ